MFSKALIIDENGNQINQQDSPFEYQNISRFAWLRKFFETGNCLCHSSVLLRRTIFSSLGYYDERFKNLPDLDFWVDSAKNSHFTSYRMNWSSIVNVTIDKMKALTIYQTITEVFLKPN